MSEDVFADWKKGRFVVADSSLIDLPESNLIILSDVSFWNDNYDSLLEWCKNNNAVTRGMTVTCGDHALTLFLLRWS